MRRIWIDRICFLAISLVVVLVSTTTAWQSSGTADDFMAPEEEASAQQVDLEAVRALFIGTAEPLSEEEQTLYDSTVKVLLTEDLWTERDMYDACHYMMIPMYYAFWSGDTETIQMYRDFFARFTADVTGVDSRHFQEVSQLNRLHFFYLCTQFMNLCAANDFDELIPTELPDLAQNCAADYLLYHTANWGTEPTVIEHMRQVIAGKEYSRSYYGTIEDFDMFTLGILCDLKCFYGMRGETYDGVLDTAADLAYQIFSSPQLNQETELGGWLFQPGVYYDHSDMAYAGNETITEGIKPKLREDVPSDSSHSLRLPLLLRSYQSAQTTQDRWDLFELREEQLANQMVNYVLKYVDGHWLTTTFMDGTNGVYRYSYHEDGVGLEGYDLSGTFLLGWWVLLNDDRITVVYQDILETFPMEGNISNPYFDHATIREQNPFFDMDTAFENGMFECIVTCASKL